jgi:hypothetical protein
VRKTGRKIVTGEISLHFVRRTDGTGRACDNRSDKDEQFRQAAFLVGIISTHDDVIYCLY